MKNTIKLALLAAAVGVTALATAAPSDAHWMRYHRDSVRIYNDYGYGAGYGGYGAYAYAAPGYYGPYSWSASSRNERDCMRSPGSQAYVPCTNHQ